jgi:tetratricopeptide (TPR) repeat protein
VVAVLCFVNAPWNDFCDDGVPVVQLNAKVNEPHQWLTIWTTDHWSDMKDTTPNRDLLYRPVSLASYRIVRMIGGEGPFGQLLANVLLHALISVLIVRLCRHLRGSNAAAMVAGVVFAVLPIHTEVIANVVGRADLLATVGVLLAVLAHRRSMIAGQDWDIAQWRIAAALAAFIAMGSKENGIAVVLMVVVLDKLWYQPWRAASRDRPWWSFEALQRFTYLLIPMVAYFALRMHALEGHLFQRPALTKTVNVLVDAPTWQHTLGVIQLWGMYWAKTVWPSVLCVNYSINSIRLATSATDPHVLIGVFVAVVLVVASVLAWRRGIRRVAYLSISILICYAPVANALVLIQVFFAERIWYLPSVWVAILLGLAAGPYVRRLAGCLVAGAIALALTERCWIRNAEWENNRSLYAAACRDHPDAVGALRLYGQTLVRTGEIERGIEYLEQAIAIDQGFTDAHRALGQAHLRAGAYPAALEHLKIANMQVPGHRPTTEAFEYVSDQLSILIEPELQRLRERADSNPEDLDAELALLRKLEEVGRIDEILTRLQQAEGRFGTNVDWQTQYAVTLVYLDRRDDAISRYERCLDLDPANPHLTVELAMLLLERREGDDLDKAWRLATHAADLAPGAYLVLVCQAEILAARGDVMAAGRMYRDAIRALPPGSSQRDFLEARARALGQ